jgi:hypothetical protein
MGGSEIILRSLYKKPVRPQEGLIERRVEYGDVLSSIALVLNSVNDFLATTSAQATPLRNSKNDG